LDEEGRVAAPTLKPELHTAQFIWHLYLWVFINIHDGALDPEFFVSGKAWFH
jgi:hypothetical protein